jgi:transposase
LTQIHGLGPYLALKLVGECGTDLSAWPSAKHFTSWLSLAPRNKISGGKILSSATQRSNNRAASLLRLAAVTVGRTETALEPAFLIKKCASGLRISESCCAATTLRRFEELPDADRV